jgi:hypothetical protein
MKLGQKLPRSSFHARPVLGIAVFVRSSMIAKIKKQPSMAAHFYQ